MAELSYDGYRAIADVYDRLNAEIDYEGWADFVEACFTRYLPQRPKLLLDLACGTGSMTLALAARGYDMIGVDGSADMLSVAYERASDAGISGVLFLLQDMRAFELYGTVEAVTCCLDSLNYLLTEEDVFQCFSCVHNYLDPDGLFLFDVNTPYKFSEIYGDNAYILEDETDSGRADGQDPAPRERGAVYCGWQNHFDPADGVCTFDLSLFEETEEGIYRRSDEQQKERCYSLETLKHLLCRAGFEWLGCYGDWNFGAPSDRCQRWYLLTRCKKE